MRPNHVPTRKTSTETASRCPGQIGTPAISPARRALVAAALVGGSAYWLLPDAPARATAVRPRPTRGIVGQMAPELRLDYWIGPNGLPGNFSVLANRGKWVLLKCFQDWCPGCHSSGFPTLQQFASAFSDHPRVAMAAIQTVFEGFDHNTLADVRRLQVRYRLPIVMGHDPGNRQTGERPQTMIKYRTGGTPWLILIAPDGRVVFNGFHADPVKLVAYVRSQLA